jgi:hypothetical protein
MRHAQLTKSHDSSCASDRRLDIDILASTEEDRALISFLLDGWTWHEIKKRLGNK